MKEKYVCPDGFIENMDARITRATDEMRRIGDVNQADHVEEMWDVVARTMQTEQGEKVRPYIEAEWIYRRDKKKGTEKCVCSACRGCVPYNVEEWNVPDEGEYCPYCGATMKGIVRDEDYEPAKH